MKYCSNCGTRLNDNDKICRLCGIEVSDADDDLKGDNSHDQFTKAFIKNINYITTKYASPSYLREIETFESIKMLENKIKDANALLSNKKNNVLYNIFKSNKLSEEEINLINEIKNFPIPDYKEAFMEFFTMISSNIDCSVFAFSINTNKELKEISSALLSKMEQSYQMACTMFKEDDKEFKEIKKIYTDTNDKIKYFKTSRLKFIIEFIIFALLAYGINILKEHIF